MSQCEAKIFLRISQKPFIPSWWNFKWNHPYICINELKPKYFVKPSTPPSPFTLLGKDLEHILLILMNFRIYRACICINFFATKNFSPPLTVNPPPLFIIFPHLSQLPNPSDLLNLVVVLFAFNNRRSYFSSTIFMNLVDHVDVGYHSQKGLSKISTLFRQCTQSWGVIKVSIYTGQLTVTFSYLTENRSKSDEDGCKSGCPVDHENIYFPLRINFVSIFF